MGLISQWGGGVKGKRDKMFFKSLAQGVLWGIWKEINRRILEGKVRGIMEVVDSILYEVGSWLLVS